MGAQLVSSYPWAVFLASLPWTVLAVVVLLGATFGVAVRLGKHAVVDIVWGLGFVAISAASWLLSSQHGDPLRRGVLLALVTVWGVRLAAHIAARSRGHGEDPRYEALLDKADGRNPRLHALRSIYLPQGMVMWFVSLPVQVGMFAPDGLAWLSWAGVALWSVGMVFEAVGDRQLAAFRADPSSRGKVLDTGLWRYTRHPNYFGDACVWWGIFVVSAGAWPGILTVLSPLAMTYLLVKGTGKPLLEKGMASTRPGYAQYVSRTSGFVPMPPRKHPIAQEAEEPC